METGAEATMAHADLPDPGTNSSPWPALDYAAWKDTCATLHLWTQIVGKIRLAQTPWTQPLLARPALCHARAA